MVFFLIWLSPILLSLPLALAWLFKRRSSWKQTLRVAVNLFSFAAEQGFVGIAIYIAAWIIAAPIMAIICVVLGIIGWEIDKIAEHEASQEAHQAPQDELERLKWQEEDRRYDEALAEKRRNKSVE